MSRTVYVNGVYADERQALVSVFDRAFLFADAVYEVSAVLDGKLLDNDAHMARLKRSLGELRMDMPFDKDELVAIQREVIRRNNLIEGSIYLQVSRGIADRDFRFPVTEGPGLVMFTQARSLIDDPLATRGMSIITVPDLRWKRRDIKTVGLLGSSIARQQAVDAGVDDAWMVEDDLVTEGTSNNAFIVNDTGHIVTRHLGNDILHGITRGAVLELSRRTGIVVEERPFSVAEAKQATEAFITSSTAFVLPVVQIDNHTIGTGAPGPISGKLRQLYIEMARATAH